LTVIKSRDGSLEKTTLRTFHVSSRGGHFLEEKSVDDIQEPYLIGFVSNNQNRNSSAVILRFPLHSPMT
jgi:hypothetical protein